MPTTLLTALAVTLDVGPSGGWQPSTGTEVFCVNTDDPTAGGGSAITTIGAGAVGSTMRFSYSDLPLLANGGVINLVSIRTTSRRSGGSTSGEYRVLIYDPVSATFVITASHFPGAPGGAGLATFIDPFPVPPAGAGTVWTPEIVNRCEIGVDQSISYGTGVGVYFIGPSITWTPGGQTREVLGI